MEPSAAASDISALQIAGTELLGSEALSEDLSFKVVDTPEVRVLFDEALDLIHYAGACRRVGRLLRLAAIKDRQWIGGVVLGSPFPAMKDRDEAFGLSAFAKGWKGKGWSSSWVRENADYWKALQSIINHARTFVFPQFQGKGLGIAIHRLLLSEGKRLWQDKYPGPVLGFDTLCTHPRSKLFANNGWILVGRTKGFARDRTVILSKRVSQGLVANVSDNAGLSRRPESTGWWIWVRLLT